MNAAQHPQWCDPALCTVVEDAGLPRDGGEHRSQPLTLATAGMTQPFGGPLTAYLTQRVSQWPGGSTPVLHLAFPAGDIAQLPVATATVMLTQLYGLVASATGPPGPRSGDAPAARAVDHGTGEPLPAGVLGVGRPPGRRFVADHADGLGSRWSYV